MSLGVALLPSKKVKKSLDDLVKKISIQEDVSRFLNIFHLSLYQIRTLNKNISLIKNALEEIAKRMNSLWLSFNAIEKVAGNLFLIENGDADGLEELSRLVTRALKEFVIEGCYLEQIEKRDFLIHSSLIKEYGIFWGLPDISFDPHITLAYDFKGHEAYDLKNPIEGEFFEIILGKIGFQGNLENIIETVSFGKNKIDH